MVWNNNKSGTTGTVLRIFFMVILLAAVGVVIFVAMRGLSIKEPMTGKSPTLFEQFVTSGGWIVWFILLPMSFGMIYLAVYYAMTIRSKNLAPKGMGDEIGKMAMAAGLKELLNTLNTKDDIVSIAIASALKKGREDWFRLREAFFESIQEQAMKLSRTVEWSNLLGNISPMVGLFGTVVGMIELFGAIVTAGGSPQPIQLAHGISVALVTTFWGLLIAIPALSVYGIFRNRIEAIINEAISEGEDALLKIRNGIAARQRPQESKAGQEIAAIDTKSSAARQSTNSQK